MASENKGKTGHRFRPGVSGNPGGRPKGVAYAREYIEAQTEGGKALIDFHLGVMRGEVKLTIAAKNDDGLPLVRVPEVKEMQHSADWLADRLWGKAAQALELSGADGEPLEFTIIRKVAK